MFPQACCSNGRNTQWCPEAQLLGCKMTRSAPFRIGPGAILSAEVRAVLVFPSSQRV